MSKTVKFTGKPENPHVFLKDVLTQIEDVSPEVVFVQMKMPDGTWATGWAGATDIMLHGEAIVHMQVDLMDRFMKDNIDKYIQFI